jgi:hypothetical protein
MNKNNRLMRRDVNRGEFLDRLRQRLVVERAAISLYELAIRRLRTEPPMKTLVADLERFLGQEELHAAMLEQLLTEIEGGRRGDFGSATVNIARREMGTLLDLAADRDVSTHHMVEVLLLAERFDGVGWEMLLEAAREAELDDEYLRSFRVAAREEAEHTHVLRTALARSERERLLGVEGHA